MFVFVFCFVSAPVSDEELDWFLELYTLWRLNLTFGDIVDSEDAYYFMPKDLEAFLGV